MLNWGGSHACWRRTACLGEGGKDLPGRSEQLAWAQPRQELENPDRGTEKTGGREPVSTQKQAQGLRSREGQTQGPDSPGVAGGATPSTAIRAKSREERSGLGRTGPRV